MADGIPPSKGSPQWSIVESLIRMMMDPKAAWWAKGLAVGGILYVVSPVDFIPDVLPVIGFADDAMAVIGLLMALFAAARRYGSDRSGGGPTGLLPG